jgi:hypothetical protein
MNPWVWAAHFKALAAGLVSTVGLAIAAISTAPNEAIAVAASICAVGTLVVAVMTLYLTRKVREVHVLVNARFTRVLEFLGLAEEKIAESRSSGQPVPPADDRHDIGNL